MEKANEIIEREHQILADERDKEIFFNTLMKDNEPNEALQKAARDYWNHNTAQ